MSSTNDMTQSVNEKIVYPPNTYTTCCWLYIIFISARNCTLSINLKYICHSYFRVHQYGPISLVSIFIKRLVWPMGNVKNIFNNQSIRNTTNGPADSSSLQFTHSFSFQSQKGTPQPYQVALPQLFFHFLKSLSRKELPPT